MTVWIVVGSLEDCYDELGTRYQLPVYVLSAPTNLQLDSSDVDDAPERLSPSCKERKRGSELSIRLQLSSGSTLRLTLRSNDSVLLVKQHVSAAAAVTVDDVRLFFAGKQLTDNTRLKDAGLRKNYTLQAVLSDARLSMSSLQADTAADMDVTTETPSTNEEACCGVKSSLPALTETLTVNREQLGLTSAERPETRSEEQTGTSTERVTELEQTGTSEADTRPAETLATSDLPAASAPLQDVEASCSGVDAPV